MKKLMPLFSVISGIPLLIIFVFLPFKAIVISAMAFNGYGDNVVILKMLGHAHDIDIDNNKILSLIGDISLAEKKLQISLWAYAKAIENSPADAALRAKYGIALINMGYDGLFALKEANKLEPNNPFYIQEIARLTSLNQSLMGSSVHTQ